MMFLQGFKFKPLSLVQQRLGCVFISCILFATVLLVRAGYVQLWHHPRLAQMAKKQFQSSVLIRPRRGDIMDRHGKPLAVNLETHSLAANPSKIKNKKEISQRLSKAILLKFQKIYPRMLEKREFVWIKRHLSEDDMRRLKQWGIMNSEGNLIPGFWLVRENERMYPHGRLAAHVLGDVNIDSEGLEGVELWMNERLRGKVVSVAALKDAFGRPTFIDAVAAKSVQEGESVMLSIDAALQFEVEQQLSMALEKTGSRSGTIIVMNAVNGEILAMANEPSFNPNDQGVPVDQRRNRAVTDGFEPGSTLKAILMAGVLSQGGRLTDQVWGDKGSFVVQGHRISEAMASEKFEWVSLKMMLQVSSNVAAAKFALKLGAETYLKTLQAFGFGSKTGLGFPGEIAGKLPVKKNWSTLTLANIGFGQGILVTPLQMTRAYAAIINGGWLVKPTLLKTSSQVLIQERPLRILSQKVSRDVMESLVAVTEEGTGKQAALAGYRIGGKTGTAQMVDPMTGKYSHEHYIASFIGFPVSVDPKIVIFTSLTQPKGVYFGAATAAPLFREVLSAVVNRLSLPAHFKSTLASSKKGSPLPVVSLKPMLLRYQDQVQLSQAAPIVPRTQGSGDLGVISKNLSVPSFKGLSAREVVRALKGYPVRLEIKGTGLAYQQSPEPGKIVAEGARIRLWLSEP